MDSRSNKLISRLIPFVKFRPMEADRTGSLNSAYSPQYKGKTKGNDGRLGASDQRRGLGRFILGMIVITAIAIAAETLARLVLPYMTVPPMIAALVLGMALAKLGSQSWMQPAITFCLKRLLRYAIALLGLRVVFGDITALGWPTTLVIIAAMLLTIGSGVLLARMLGQDTRYGVLVGTGTAICGASATLATSSILPSYSQKSSDTAFVVIAVNALSTLAMVAYPPLLLALGFNEHTTGILLGATIHDVAQVVGAGYSISETAGNSAVIVKLFRVFLLFPIVLAIGFYFARQASGVDASKVPAPLFALGFLAFAAINSTIPLVPSLASVIMPIKSGLVEASNWGMMLAITALGLGTTVSSLLSVGWRRISIAVGTTLVILAAAILGMAIAT